MKLEKGLIKCNNCSPVNRTGVRGDLGPIKSRLWRCASARPITVLYRAVEFGSPNMKQIKERYLRYSDD